MKSSYPRNGEMFGMQLRDVHGLNSAINACIEAKRNDDVNTWSAEWLKGLRGYHTAIKVLNETFGSAIHRSGELYDQYQAARRQIEMAGSILSENGGAGIGMWAISENAEKMPEYDARRASKMRRIAQEHRERYGV